MVEVNQEYEQLLCQIEELNLRVARGSVLLQERKPGWQHRIDLERFHVGAFKTCVLGQVYGGNYFGGLEELFPEGYAYTDEATHGFIPSSVSNIPTASQWEYLNEEWRRIILALREREPETK